MVAAQVSDNGTCKAGFGRDDAPHAVFPSNHNIHKASSIMVGMDQKTATAVSKHRASAVKCRQSIPFSTVS